MRVIGLILQSWRNKSGFPLNFIFDDTFYEDDTNKTVLMKSYHQRCTPYSFEGKNYVYATYFDLDKKINAIGFDYENKKHKLQRF